ncbi:MAG: hypothetical protein BZ136_07165 [Methanosphaera sp. rholeuAM74]|nr:MAG: hypothetical protein BZ136_07165 [Methanosphaera sp. rholeuAM74]
MLSSSSDIVLIVLLTFVLLFVVCVVDEYEDELLLVDTIDVCEVVVVLLCSRILVVSDVFESIALTEPMNKIVATIKMIIPK